MISAYEIERQEEKERAWNDFRNEIADLLYDEAHPGKIHEPPGDAEWALYHLSEDTRILEYNPARICDLVHDLERIRDKYELYLTGIGQVIEQLTTLLDHHFGVSPSFWSRTRNPEIHETARSYRVPSIGARIKRRENEKKGAQDNLNRI